MLKGIDVSSHQSTINLAKVPGDFVIIKATQGTTYVNSAMVKQYESAKSAGKLIGLYHYAGGGDPVAEANFFLKTIKNYIGTAILVLDWEGTQNAKFGYSLEQSYITDWMNKVYTETNITPFFYTYKSVLGRFKYIANKYPLWLAYYRSNNVQNGYRATPPRYGSSSPWSAPTIYQYSSNGRLANYCGALDLNIAYIDKTQWINFQTPHKTEIEVKDMNNGTYQIKASNGTTYTLIDVKYGTKGEEVKFLEQLLQAKGFYKGSIDGISGPQLMTAIANYQASKNLAVCDENTWKSLLQ